MVSKEDILYYVKNKYDTNPEYIFEKFPNYCVLRHHDTNKWYGLIMTVNKTKLGLAESSETIIIDVKVEPELIGSLIQKEGFYKAYHMNKEHWISIDLSSLHDTTELFSLIDTSYLSTK